MKYLSLTVFYLVLPSCEESVYSNETLMYSLEPKVFCEKY